MNENELRSVPAALIENARAQPDAVAFHVVSGDHVDDLTWGELAAQAAGYADRLVEAGVRPRQVVVLCLTHGPWLYPAFLGAMLTGAIPSFVPFPTPKQDPELYWEAHRVLFARVQPAAVVTYPENADDLAAILPESTRLLVHDWTGADGPATGDWETMPLPMDLDEVAFLQHSSGTTGHKKGVELTHRQVALQVQAYTSAQGMSADARVASWLPVYHDMGLFSAFLGPVLLGSTTVTVDAFEWVDDPHVLLRLVDRYRCGFVWLPNFALNHLMRTRRGDESYRLDTLVSVMVASEPIKPEHVDRFAEAFASHGLRPEAMLTGYGLAETAMAVSLVGVGGRVTRCWFDATALRLGRAVPRPEGPGARGYLSCGRVLADIEVRVVPGEDALSGTYDPGGVRVGELQFRGPFVFSGYYHNPEATAAAFDDGWVRSGDLGCFLGDDLFVLGRIKDVIIQHGVNYYAHDLEAVVNAVAGVKPGRCVAVAVEDEAAGSERVEVLCERDQEDSRSDAEVRAAVKRAVLDRYQVAVARVHFVPDGWLVKTTSGKISRSENLARLLRDPPPELDPGEEAPAVSVGPEDQLAGDVRRMVATTFDVPVDAISRETVALDVPGWDSLGTSVLMTRLERLLGILIPEDVPALSNDVGELIDRLRELVAAGS